MLNGTTIYFDMDGTIASLYDVPRWLDKLHAEDETPYLEAKVMHPSLSLLLESLKAAGATLGVVSWSAMGGSKAYNKRVRKAKKQWLETHFKGLFSEFHVIKYGTPKSKAVNRSNAILVDDNAKVRTSWENSKACNSEMPTIDASDTMAMMNALGSLLDAIAAN